jgi:hypothetical protein
MNRTVLPFALVAALAAIEQGVAVADVAPYIESATAQQPRTRAGIALDGDGMLLKADLSLQAQDHAAQVVPRLSSSVALTDRLGLETKVELPWWSTQSDALRVNTRVHFDSAAAFVDRLEGRFWHLPDGQAGQSVELGFHKKLRASGGAAPLTIRSHATFESTTRADASGDGLPADARVDTRKVGFETELTGVLPNLPPGRSAVRIRLEKVGGTRDETTESIGYTQNWVLPEFGRIGVNVRMLRDTADAANELQPSLRLTWSAVF